VLTLCALIRLVSEEWWVTGLLTYLPRQPYALPAVVLLPVTLWRQPRMAAINVLSILIVLGPLMSPSVRFTAAPAPTAERHVLRVASGNLQEGKGDLLTLLAEIEAFRPDIVVFQEAWNGCEVMQAEFADWELAHLGPFFIGSRYPLRVVDHCRALPFDRWTALAVEIDTPDGAILLTDVHLMTPRHGAMSLTLLSPLTGEGVEEFEWHTRLREDEADETRRFIDRLPDRPRLVLGDFNAVATSSIYTARWSDWQNAFEVAGAGYGYTSPCNASRRWLPNTPWMRIDHVLADERWTIHSCRTGETAGSDHRLLFTELSLR
jgi:endonuclease/exonuclease/phosphatase (EEP) superfamily protein YafD